jgi:hypothetical protein
MSSNTKVPKDMQAFRFRYGTNEALNGLTIAVTDVDPDPHQIER